MDVQNRAKAASKSKTAPTSKLPKGWTPTHTAFVKDLARNGEDAGSILILFEAEFPRVVGVTEDVVKRVWE